MEFDIFWAIAALAGGYIGAAIGGNFGFVFTGFMALLGLGVAAGTNNSWVLDYVAFGPFMGPHVCFAGGVAAAAYAAKKGYIDSGRDVTSPLARLGRPDVLMVGALFGLLGYLIKNVVVLIPWVGKNVDAVALTVVISALIVRLAVSRQSLIVPERFNTDGGSKWAPNDTWSWVRYQEKVSQLVPMGIMFGIGAAGAALMIVEHFGGGDPTANAFVKNAQVLPFAWSAVVILFLCLGMDMPVQHHITLPAALAAVKFYPIVDNLTVCLLIGAAFGVFGGLFGELMSRVFHQRGDSHIDPPAFAIFPASLIVAALTSMMA